MLEKGGLKEFKKTKKKKGFTKKKAGAKFEDAILVKDKDGNIVNFEDS